MVLRPFVRGFVYIMRLAPAMHRADIQHVVPRRRHHAHLLYNKHLHLVPELGQAGLFLAWPHPVVSQFLHPHAAGIVHCARLHTIRRNVLGLRV